MPKPQFILNWFGNKYDESKKNLNIEDFEKYDTIIEPFCGSFGFSRWIYDNYPDKKFIFYDNDDELINFYKNLQTNDIEEILKKYNEIMDKFNTEDIFYKKNDETKKPVMKHSEIRNYINTIDDEVMKYLLVTNVLKIRFTRVSFKRNTKWNDLIKIATFIHSPFEEIDFSIYEKEKTLIYLDPPYLDKCNRNYEKVNLDDDFYLKFFSVFNTNNSLFIHSENDYLDEMIGKNKVGEYTKMYDTLKRYVKHIIYQNTVCQKNEAQPH